MISFEKYKKISSTFNDYIISEDNLKKWYNFFIKGFPELDSKTHIVASLVILEDVEQNLYGDNGWRFGNQEVEVGNGEYWILDEKRKEIINAKSDYFGLIKKKCKKEEKILKKFFELLDDEECDGYNLPSFYSNESLSLMGYILNDFYKD